MPEKEDRNMILLRDIRDYVANLGIAEDERCYIGLLPDKQMKSIGTYQLKRNNGNPTPIGGDDNRSFSTKSISFLIHWNKSPSDTEKAANELFIKLKDTKMQEVNEQIIKFIKLFDDEPVSVGTDSDGVYEYVIECAFYFEKERNDN